MSDINGIWDWAMRVSEAQEKQDKIRELQSQINRCGTRCGDCDKWMKSRECPQERNVNGFNRGPSMNGTICNQFVENSSTTELRTKWQSELNEITNPTNL